MPMMQRVPPAVVLEATLVYVVAAMQSFVQIPSTKRTQRDSLTEPLKHNRTECFVTEVTARSLYWRIDGGILIIS